MCLGSLLEQQDREVAEFHREYYGEEWSPSLLPSVLVSDQEYSKRVWLVLELHHGDSHIQGSWCSALDLMEGKVSRETPWVSRRYHGCPKKVGKSPEKNYMIP